MSMLEKVILLVDDDPSILRLLEVILVKEGYKNIYTASNGQEAIKLFDMKKPDLIILDVMMPGMDGYEVCREIRKNSMAHIIFLSAKSDESDKLISYALGGDEYLTKPFSPKELTAKIRAVFNRQDYYLQKAFRDSDNNYQFGEFVLNTKKKMLQKGTDDILLTAKEYALLEFLITNKNITVSKDIILEQVWGTSFEGYDNTVMVHIRHLREKIEKNPANPVFIKTIKGLGYLFDLKN